MRLAGTQTRKPFSTKPLRMKVKKRGTWKNSTQKHKAQPQKYFFPKKVAQIQQIIRTAEKTKTRVRAVGSGHSFSDVAVSNGYLINIKHFDRIHSLKAEDLSPSCKIPHDRLIYAEAGITIQRLNKKLNRKDLCLENMGAVDEQTLAGAISTGTHGTGVELPAMSGMVRAIMIVAHEGQVYRIEPSAGLVDQAAFEAKNKNIKLIQDDQWFNAALVNLGCFGIIYAYVIEVKPMYWLAETKEVVKWSTVKRQLLSKNWRRFLTEYEVPDRVHPKTKALRPRKDRKWKKKWERLGVQQKEAIPVRALSIIVNPYKLREEDENTCLISRHICLKERPKRSKLHDLLRPLQYILVGSFPPLPFIFYRLVRGVNRFMPTVMPFVIENTVKSLRDDIYTNKGYRVMYQGAEYIKLKAYDAEYAFDLKENRKGAINAIEAIMEQAESFRSESNLFQSSPVGMRFVKASDAYLTPENGRDVCYVDTPVLLGTQGGDGILDRYQDILIKFGGTPHWGKVNNRFVGRKDLLLKYYPKLKQWEEIFQKLNPLGIFSNNFSDRLGLGRLTTSDGKGGRGLNRARRKPKSVGPKVVK